MTLLGLILAFATLIIPAAGIAAPLESLTQVDGQLVGPNNPDGVGAFRMGGNTLLAGHVDWTGERRPFSKLPQLVEGDQIILSDGAEELHYHVVWSGSMDVDDDETWTQVMQARGDILTLVTCSGPFSLSRHEYLERFIVVAAPD